jgi:hypothetical protein
MTYLDAVTARLPWTVRTAEWTDPTLVVAGDDWMLSISCAWRVVGPDGSAYGWSSPDAEDRVWDLIGRDVVALAPQATGPRADPTLVLSGDVRLEVFCDTDDDAYVLRSGENQVIVGPFPPGSWGEPG